MPGSEDEETSDHDVSWVTVKKRKVRVELKNRYAPLQQSDNGNSDNQMELEPDQTSEREIKPPEFCLDNVDNVEGMVKRFSAIAGENTFTYKCLKDNTMKIQAKSISAYNALKKFIKDKNLSWYTYQVKSERSFDVVVNGLHRSFDVEDLKAILTAKGHIVRSANVMMRRVFDRESETTKSIYMDKFMVHLEPRPNNKDIYNIDAIDHCIVSVEPPHRRKVGPSQCKNCQSRGHTANYCYRASVCVKCAGHHHTSKCSMGHGDKLKCANCGGEHTANYLGCPEYQKQLRARGVKRGPAPPPPRNFNMDEHSFEPLGQPQAPPQVRSTHSYSDVALFKRIEELMEKQIETTNTLMNMMSTLISHLCRK